MLRELGDSRGTRLAYDRGRLEIISPSNLHEDVTAIARRLIEAYADAVGINVQSLRSWTLDRDDLEKAIEPDECYYIQNFLAIASKKNLDLAVDPPPDLAIEVEISRSMLPKQPIYEALGVPEVWRYDGKRFAILLRGSAGGYAESRQSLCLPDLPIDEFNRFVQIGLKSHQPAAVGALREWMKQRPTG
jgi:Uma2 family endonuclease